MSIDEGAGASPRRHEALAHQPVVADAHCGPRNAQSQGQLATRRQTLTRAKSPFEDRGTQLSVDLAGEVVAANEAYVEFH